MIGLDADMLQFAGAIGGTSWQGQKTLFFDEERVPKSAPVKTSEGTTQEDGVSLSSSMPCDLQKAKWKSIARRLLELAPDGTMAESTGCRMPHDQVGKQQSIRPLWQQNTLGTLKGPHLQLRMDVI